MVWDFKDMDFFFVYPSEGEGVDVILKTCLQKNQTQIRGFICVFKCVCRDI